jgi:hypothetical protein
MAITTSNSINVKATLREEFALISKLSPNGLRANTRLIVGMQDLPVNHREYEMIAFSLTLRIKLALHQVNPERILLRLCLLPRVFSESN